MDRPRIALVNAAHEGGPARRNFRRELDADLVEFHVSAGDLPPALDPGTEPPYDGLVVTGSSSSVYWEDDWIGATRAWVRDAVEAGVPALGVCYGHQLLADALGGTVEDMGEFEIGYRTIEHRGGRLFDGVPGEFIAFTTHSDVVTALPPGADLTAENDYGVQGFRRDHVFGVQFHPEYDAETARRVTRGKDLAPQRERRVLDGITRENYRRACAAKIVFENFLEYVREVRTSGATAADD